MVPYETTEMSGVHSIVSVGSNVAPTDHTRPVSA